MNRTILVVEDTSVSSTTSFDHDVFSFCSDPLCRARDAFGGTTRSVSTLQNPTGFPVKQAGGRQNHSNRPKGVASQVPPTMRISKCKSKAKPKSFYMNAHVEEAEKTERVLVNASMVRVVEGSNASSGYWEELFDTVSGKKMWYHTGTKQRSRRDPFW